MKEKYINIVRDLIEKSYPVIRGRKIHILEIRFRYYAFSIWIPPALRIIAVSRRAVRLSDKALKGLLAHELSHQERYLSMGLQGYLIFIVKYIFSREAREKEEKSTDMVTIEKGYARELHELSVITSRDENHKHIQRNYLTPVHIRAYAESKGKW
jgi:Zn-dependent protease with chaperone function